MSRQPCPCSARIQPSSASDLSALRSVGQLTWYPSDISRSDGNRVVHSPDCNDRRMLSANCVTTDRKDGMTAVGGLSLGEITGAILPLLPSMACAILEQ